ncbi:hypothetical protein ACR8AL_14255 [Clavibacter sepedonicus]|uniref:Uncharacterized protein n=1 Tax=Clavibacter sepedonicus TaxID=31964 RepID=B0RJA2_CLASE|nr:MULTISPECIES: hypothetical protein [Clavibacter]MBD5383125.1 hypothetical protein [Clavibacter sp.]OQJ45241.1 hypothetical protein B5P19_15350 [Clavibacter sepedonicus]OQJ50876.1 hypothetical protein B5P20_15685 [Clavibacter sepedonicus]UUK67325.1 hypothetical protein LRE50_16330 [Clavibacter sepedonicus]CAQ03292.1 hypothetical protein pCSL0049 [Clavibacter sepedonicus]
MTKHFPTSPIDLAAVRAQLDDVHSATSRAQEEPLDISLRIAAEEQWKQLGKRVPALLANLQQAQAALERANAVADFAADPPVDDELLAIARGADASARPTEEAAGARRELYARGARDAIAGVLAVHHPQTRYSYDDGETSHPTEDDAHRYFEADPYWTAGVPLPELYTLEVCAECGALERRGQELYQDSLWPCRTIKTITPWRLIA